MGEQKFVLPEGKITIDFDPHLWGLLEKGVLSHVNTSGLVSLNTGNKAKISIFIEESSKITKEDYDRYVGDRKHHVPKGQNYFEHAFSRLVTRMIKFMLVDSPNWIMFGYVNRRNGGTVPIVIVYSEAMNGAFYSMKRDSDTDQPSRERGGFAPWMN